MKLKALFVAFYAQAISAVVSSELATDSTTISYQAISSSDSPVVTLTSLEYNPSTLTASILSYEPPEISADDKTLRIGIYDASTSTWKSSTSVTSAENFAKGYQPTFVVSLDAQGGVQGVMCRSARIDAGQTRDFGPRVRVRKVVEGKQPVLNRPVVLSPEGKVAQPEPEKTLLQKYWWVLLGGVMLLMTAGGGQE